MGTSFTKRSDRQTRTVLLVEGSSAARDRHAATLKRNGYEVMIANSIEEGRAQFSPRKFGLVVVSLNGFGAAAADLCNEIKESDSNQLIALIFHPDQQLPATDCPTIIFTTEPDEYFLARVETLTAAHAA
jgi:DNA-binding NtrC family response regulator